MSVIILSSDLNFVIEYFVIYIITIYIYILLLLLYIFYFYISYSIINENKK